MTYRTLTAACAIALAASTALAQDGGVKLGFLAGITGPIESLIPPIQGGAQLAVDQINEAGGIGDGQMIELVVGDTTCVDATAAANAADRMVNVDEVSAIVGAMCSGATISAANNAGVPGTPGVGADRRASRSFHTNCAALTA